MAKVLPFVRCVLKKLKSVSGSCAADESPSVSQGSKCKVRKGGSRITIHDIDIKYVIVEVLTLRPDRYAMLLLLWHHDFRKVTSLIVLLTLNTIYPFLISNSVKFVVCIQ